MSTPAAEVLEAYRRALGREGHVIARSPDRTFQQLHNRLQWEGDAVQRRLVPERQRRSLPGSRPWFRLATPLPESRALLRTIKAEGALAFAADGGSLLTLGAEGVLTSWDVGTGAEIQTLGLRDQAGEGAGVGCLTSPDGSFLVSSGSDGVIRLWDVHSGAERCALFDPHRGAVTESGHGEAEDSRRFTTQTVGRGLVCAVSPDGAFVVGGNEAGLLTIWDSATGAVVRTVEAHEGQVTTCAFSPDGTFVVSGGADGAVQLWCLTTGKLSALEGGPERTHPATDAAPRKAPATFEQAFAQSSAEVDARRARFIWSCSVAPDASFIVAVSGESLRVWEAVSGRLRWSRSYFQLVKDSFDRARGCAVSPDAALIALFGPGRLLRLWDPETGEIVSTLMGHSDPVRACAVSPDGALIASEADDGIRLWDARVRGEWESLEGHADRITSCTFDPAGTRAVSTAADEKLVVWSADSYKAERTLGGHRDAVQDCAFTPDGKRLVSAGRDNTARLWDLETGAELRRWEGDSPVWGCAVSPDGTQLLLGSGGRASLWDLETGECLLTSVGRGEVWRCAYAPDGSWAVSSGGALAIWDMPSGRQRATLAGHEGLVDVCAVSPDGTFLVSGGEDASVRIWDATTGAQRRVLKGHAGAVWGCAVSPDGRHILSASWDATVRCWSVDSGLEEARLDLPAGAHGAAFHPASLRAVCGDVTGWVHFIELMGLDLGPIVVTAREEGGNLSFCCPVCRHEAPVDRRELGSARRCPECAADLLLNVAYVHPRSSPPLAAGHRPTDFPPRPGPRSDAELEQTTKTCAACGNEFELLRYACPRCGSAAATSSSAAASDFMQMRQQSASRHVDRGGQLFQQGRADEAEAEFREAMKANPWNATAHGNLGVVMLRRGRLEDAIRLFERAVDIDPRVAGGNEMLAKARAELAKRRKSGVSSKPWGRSR
jgi:WD40 repeat protein